MSDTPKTYEGDDLLTWLENRTRFDHFAHTVEDGGNVLTSVHAPCENSKAAAERIRKAEAALAAYDAAPAPSDGIAAGMRRAAEIARDHTPATAGGPFSHTNSMRVVAIDITKAILAAIPAAGAWEPPPEADRPDGFECLGEFHGERFKVQWKADLGGYGLWFAGTLNRFIAPTDFAPLPYHTGGTVKGITRLVGEIPSEQTIFPRK